TNEKYIGNNLYNRTSFKLKKVHVINTPEMWVRKDGAFDPIVAAEMFYTVRGIMHARARRYTNAELIERLRNLYEHRGF
ncbi:recombinase family protein, partial [Acinetobacter baumannii]